MSLLPTLPLSVLARPKSRQPDLMAGQAPQAVRVRSGEPSPSWVVVASPHSGRHYPEAMLNNARLDLRALRTSEDAWVDHLLVDAPATGATFITTDYARCWLDLNRAMDELDPLLIKGLEQGATNNSLRVQAGLGVVPRTIGEGGAIYRQKITRQDADHRLVEVYHPYHAALDAALADAHVRHGASLLLDCHSMPSSLCDGAAIDVVLGDRFGTSCSRQITDHVAHVLRDAGLTVARNAPFAGGHVTVRHGHPGLKRHALQIELRRSLYMNEVTFEPNSGFGAIQTALTKLLTSLCEKPPVT